MERNEDVVADDDGIPSPSKVIHHQENVDGLSRDLKQISEGNDDCLLLPSVNLKMSPEVDDKEASPPKDLEQISEVKDDCLLSASEGLEHMPHASHANDTSTFKGLDMTSEVNADYPTSPSKDLELSSEVNDDDMATSPPKNFELIHHRSNSLDSPSKELEVVFELNDERISPLKELQLVSETNDDRLTSPSSNSKQIFVVNADHLTAHFEQGFEVNRDGSKSSSHVGIQNLVENVDGSSTSPTKVLNQISKTNDDEPPSSPSKDLQQEQLSDGRQQSPPKVLHDGPPLPSKVSHQISEENVDVTSPQETISTVYTGSSNMPPIAPPGHRRVKSEAVTPGHRRSNSFQKLKTQIQKTWQWGGSQEGNRGPWFFNPEVLANQKRQWYKLHSRMASPKYTEPTLLFEHFIVVGLHSGSNLDAVEESFAKRSTKELEMQRSERLDYKMLQHRGPSIPTLEPELLFKYPPRKRLAVRPKDLTAFCFPEGVKARLMERTPSLSDLNSVVYGQVADNATVFGVCLHVQEIVQRPPVGVATPPSLSSGRLCQFLVSAPRCYCLLTRVPFFDLHYEMLNSIITQERLNRITEFVSEVALTDHTASVLKSHNKINENNVSRDSDSNADWKASAIPLDSAVALTAAAAGIISDEDVPTFSVSFSETPESVSATEALDIRQKREVDAANEKNLQDFDGFESETSETRCGEHERVNGNYVSGQTSPEVGSFFLPRSCTMDRAASSESLYSSVRSMGSEDEYEDVDSENDRNGGDDVVMNWAREHRNDLLQIICGYHSLPLPPRGSETTFQPLEHLQAIKYRRPAISELGVCEDCPDIKLQEILGGEVNVKLAAAEEAYGLSIWTTATVCRVLSLESVLALFTGVLLEKQVVVVCPNLGVLSAVVLSLIPMIRPFEWQSLMLPVLPKNMLDFIDAPVPFIVGIQHKPADLKMKTSDHINVNVYKDQVKKMCYMPPLPRHRELIAELGPIHARLSCHNSIAERHPVYRCNEVQAEAAGQFLTVMRRYLESLCADFLFHTITSVQSNNDRVSLLLKESFIDSFPSRDRPFIKLFVDTQQFSVLSDSRLTCFEHDHE
ncbi:uncharacterized protein LOC113349852 isoform X2 [Papaver somniferum]|uniref:uncharacterized protein LOC113349852 isoform X2 n=1 Tax=Papaver somniferum TaxID=3469 RepID=UPI000E6F5D66|nr:uncharacterized protein LOC113349852 isoform X2 [Papaver somniferum]